MGMRAVVWVLESVGRLPIYQYIDLPTILFRWKLKKRYFSITFFLHRKIHALMNIVNVIEKVFQMCVFKNGMNVINKLMILMVIEIFSFFLRFSLWFHFTLASLGSLS